MQNVNLESFAGGALQEKFDDAFEKVIRNMMDPNTPWKNKRKINVEISLEQNEDRDDITVHVAVITKLASVKPIGTRMVIGKNLATGEVFAEEYGSQCRGQMSMEDYQTREETVDGTPAEKIKEESQVLDFRKAKQA